MATLDLDEGRHELQAVSLRMRTKEQRKPNCWRTRSLSPIPLTDERKVNRVDTLYHVVPQQGRQSECRFGLRSLVFPSAGLQRPDHRSTPHLVREMSQRPRGEAHSNEHIASSSGEPCPLPSSLRRSNLQHQWEGHPTTPSLLLPRFYSGTLPQQRRTCRQTNTDNPARHMTILWVQLLSRVPPIVHVRQPHKWRPLGRFASVYPNLPHRQDRRTGSTSDGLKSPLRIAPIFSLEHSCHLLARASHTTFRMRSVLAGWVAKSLNWAAAWLTNIVTPSMVLAPLALACFSRSVSAGL